MAARTTSSTAIRVRRKDITQLFLGTGLGSRSYAIIEQGMISRLIEARAEDMRAFLEEAAGISKYKERRRETESRIGHTRENLARLADLRDEVEKQIRHLQRQAATARRYQGLKDEERRLHAELLALRLQELDSQAEGRDAVVREREIGLAGRACRVARGGGRNRKVARPPWRNFGSCDGRSGTITTSSVPICRAPSRLFNTRASCGSVSVSTSSRPSWACPKPQCTSSATSCSSSSWRRP